MNESRASRPARARARFGLLAAILIAGATLLPALALAHPSRVVFVPRAVPRRPVVVVHRPAHRVASRVWIGAHWSRSFAGWLVWVPGHWQYVR